MGPWSGRKFHLFMPIRRFEPAYPPLFDLIRQPVADFKKLCIRRFRRIESLVWTLSGTFNGSNRRGLSGVNLGPFPATGSLLQCFAVNKNKTKGTPLDRWVLCVGNCEPYAIHHKTCEECRLPLYSFFYELRGGFTASSNRALAQHVG